MNFANQINGLLGACLNTFGQAVIYTDKNLISHNSVGIFSNEYEGVDPDTGFSVVSSIPNLGIRISDWPKTPDAGEKIEINSNQYQIRHVEEDGEGGAVIIMQVI